MLRDAQGRAAARCKPRIQPWCAGVRVQRRERWSQRAKTHTAAVGTGGAGHRWGRSQSAGVGEQRARWVGQRPRVKAVVHPGARARCQALVLAGAHVGGFRDSQVNKDEQRVHDDEHHDGDLNL